MKHLYFVCLCALALFTGACSADKKPPYSQRMVESRALRTFVTNTREQQLVTAHWDYVPGLVANSVLKAWAQYPAKTDYYQAVKQYADHNLLEGDSVKVSPHNIDDLAAGKIFFTLYHTEMERGNEVDAMRYKRCADFLRNKLKYHHRRIAASQPGEGRFIHKAHYPGQLWLDGVYMGPALYAEWQHHFGEEEGSDANMEAWTDIALQFEVTFRNTWDAQKQLNYHAWASDPNDPNAFWARKEEPLRGASAEFWGRGVGWFFAGLVDALEYMPAQHPNRPRLEEIARMVAQGLARYQDPASGCWHQLLQYDSTMCADGKGDTMDGKVFYNQCDRCNYLESSASSMFAYAYLKAVRLGILDRATYLPVARKAYRGLIATFIKQEEDGYLSIVQSCASAGLGPARDLSRTGTANYYLCGKDTGITQNEGKAIGPFIMASLEAELAGIAGR